MAMTFLVVLAGSVVRMTGSGMGCPDWPKCFGLMIPPTEASEVTWQEGATYDRGRMLLKRDTLWVAQVDVHSTDFEAERARGQWVAYDKHDYAVFNPMHTWVEFINRLLGALAGLPAVHDPWRTKAMGGAGPRGPDDEDRQDRPYHPSAG